MGCPSLRELKTFHEKIKAAYIMSGTTNTKSTLKSSACATRPCNNADAARWEPQPGQSNPVSE